MTQKCGIALAKTISDNPPGGHSSWHFVEADSYPYTVLMLSHSVVSDSFATPLTVASQAPPSMEFPRQEHWSGLPLPSPTILQ